MNTDALSLALAHISYTIENLTKTNFQSSTNEIVNVKKTNVVLFCFLKFNYLAH